MSNYSDTSWTLRGDPQALPRANPMGPGGSFNKDEPSYEDPDRDLAGARYSTVQEQFYTPEQAQQVLDAALVIALRLLPPLVNEAISLGIDPEIFAEAANAKAEDILETCVYRVLKMGLDGVPPYDFSGIVPVGVMNFLDWFMNQNNGRSYQVEVALKNSYETYLETKLLNAE